MVQLLELKNIISRQLPKMPKEYIVKLVFDRNHECMAILRSSAHRIIGGICYRMYRDQRFAEIAFLAISQSEQYKGYGTRLMNKMKESMQKQGIEFLMTYADNSAIDYFQKNGFTKEYRMPQDRWKGYIKDYEGGTLMECYIDPKMDYSKVSEIIKRQTEFVHRKVSELCQNDRVYSENLEALAEPFRAGHDEEDVLRIDPRRIKGIAEAGWVPEDYEELKRTEERSFQIQCQNIYESMMKHKDIWPFKDPVSKEDVPNYYDIIKDPIDMRKIEEKIKGNQYKDREQFIKDIQRLFNNCRTYNQPDTLYYKCACNLEEFVRPLLQGLREKKHAESEDD